MKGLKKKAKSLFLVLLAALMIVSLYQAPVEAATKCSTLASAVKSSSSTAKKGMAKTSKKSKLSFVTSSYRKYASDFYYATDSDQVYVVCIVRADTTSHAKKLLTKFNSTLSSQKNNSYLSSSQKKVVKAAQTGRSGKYVWYISVSSSSSTNKKAVTKLKAKL